MLTRPAVASPPCQPLLGRHRLEHHLDGFLESFANVRVLRCQIGHVPLAGQTRTEHPSEPARIRTRPEQSLLLRPQGEFVSGFTHHPRTPAPNVTVELGFDDETELRLHDDVVLEKSCQIVNHPVQRDERIHPRNAPPPFGDLGIAFERRREHRAREILLRIEMEVHRALCGMRVLQNRIDGCSRIPTLRELVGGSFDDCRPRPPSAFLLTWHCAPWPPKTRIVTAPDGPPASLSPTVTSSAPDRPQRRFRHTLRPIEPKTHRVV